MKHTAQAIEGMIPHATPTPPPPRPIVLAICMIGGVAAVAAFLASGGALTFEEAVGYAYSFAQIGGGLLAIIARGQAAKNLPRPNRFAFMIALGLLMATGMAGVVHQAVPSLRALPAGPIEFVAWVQYVGFPLLALVVVFRLAWPCPVKLEGVG